MTLKYTLNLSELLVVPKTAKVQGLGNGLHKLATKLKELYQFEIEVEYDMDVSGEVFDSIRKSRRRLETSETVPRMGFGDACFDCQHYVACRVGQIVPHYCSSCHNVYPWYKGTKVSEPVATGNSKRKSDAPPCAALTGYVPTVEMPWSIRHAPCCLGSKLQDKIKVQLGYLASGAHEREVSTRFWVSFLWCVAPVDTAQVAVKEGLFVAYKGSTPRSKQIAALVREVANITIDQDMGRATKKILEEIAAGDGVRWSKQIRGISLGALSRFIDRQGLPTYTNLTKLEIISVANQRTA